MGFGFTPACIYGLHLIWLREPDAMPKSSFSLAGFKVSKYLTCCTTSEILVKTFLLQFK